MVCTGTEDAIQECSFEGDDIDSPCTHANDVIISCVCKLLLVYSLQANNDIWCV